MPLWLNKFQCTTFLSENFSLFTFENILEEIDLTFIVISTNTNPAQTRTIDWTRFKLNLSSLSIGKFRLVIASVQRSSYFNPHLVSVVLRYVAKKSERYHCTKSISSRRTSWNCLQMTALEALEVSVPSTIWEGRAVSSFGRRWSPPHPPRYGGQSAP